MIDNIFNSDVGRMRYNEIFDVSLIVENNIVPDIKVSDNEEIYLHDLIVYLLAGPDLQVTEKKQEIDIEKLKMSIFNRKGYRLTELKHICRKKGLKVSGRKKELVERLLQTF